MGFVQQPFAFEFDTVFWEVNDKYFVGTYVVLYSFTVHFFEHPPAAKLSGHILTATSVWTHHQ